jgi:hypothetical protein
MGFTQPVAEMSTRNKNKKTKKTKGMFLGSRAQPARKVDIFTAICKSIV